MTKEIAGVLALLSREDEASGRQGIELLRALDRADLWEELARGVTVSRRGRVYYSESLIAKHVAEQH